MTHKAIRFDTAARSSLERGVDKLVGAVRVTLGPKGQYVILDRAFGTPVITNDGVTIAKEIELGDIFENQGAQLVVEVATKTNDVAGDGTTTALVLAQTIVHEGLKNVAAGANPVILKTGMELALSTAVESIAKQSKEISGRDDVARIGTISARSEEIGGIISDAIDKVGKDGVVNVEEGQTFGMELAFTEGMQFDKGYISPYFVTDQDRQEAVLDEPYILLVDRKISSLRDILPLLNELKGQSRPLLMVCEDLDGEALTTVITNQLRGTFKVAAIRGPGFGERRRRQLEDIAILTGGEVVTDETGTTLENVRLAQLGRARRVVVTRDETTIMDGYGDEEKIRSRLARIKTELEQMAAEFDREKLQERLAKLAGGVAVIKVGAATEVELKEKKHRVEDALSATRAALEEGIVPGGGVALLRAQKSVEGLVRDLDGDERTGAMIVFRALEEPVRQIASNAGADESIVVDKVRFSGDAHGFNALTGEYEDLVKAGVIDPAMVTRSALQNAVSIGGLIVTTNVIVAEPPPDSGGASEVLRRGMNMDF
ncbi:chaperonin GroEL [Rubrobacter indicoceani]|uniref:chaperonin GroEL n=1 Tax=Rubrobacter indicoceani TaxID=2051957 RepID=UPI000E5BC0AD|nr:chaperonin GroEL [Rubrobacter indicoceani]